MPAVTVWVGGGTGAGKTTVIRTLAGRHGLRVFPLDAFWYKHAIALSEPEPGPDEQWLGRTPAEQAEEFEAFARRRWPLVLTDLAALPASPPVVVEGPQVLPDLVPAGDLAVFLVATREFQRSALGRRPLPDTTDSARALANRIEKDWLYSQRVAALAVAHGFTVVPIDGAQSVDFTLAAVAEALSPAIGWDVDRTEVRAARRWENRVVADNIRIWLNTRHVPSTAPTTYSFACECGTPGCHAMVDLPLSGLDTVPVIAPEH